MNVAVVVGKITGQLFEHTQDDGRVILSFDVKTDGEQGPLTVPCSWLGPTGKAPKLEIDATVTVIGGVRRRFYRRGGSTTSRTDLLASRVILGGPSRSRVARAKAAEHLISEELLGND